MIVAAAAGDWIDDIETAAGVIVTVHVSAE